MKSPASHTYQPMQNPEPAYVASVAAEPFVGFREDETFDEEQSNLSALTADGALVVMGFPPVYVMPGVPNIPVLYLYDEEVFMREPEVDEAPRDPRPLKRLWVCSALAGTAIVLVVLTPLVVSLHGNSVGLQALAKRALMMDDTLKQYTKFGASVVVLAGMACASVYAGIKFNRLATIKRAKTIALPPPVIDNVRRQVRRYSNRAQVEAYRKIARILLAHREEVNTILGAGHIYSEEEIGEILYETVVLQNSQNPAIRDILYGKENNLRRSEAAKAYSYKEKLYRFFRRTFTAAVSEVNLELDSLTGDSTDSGLSYHTTREEHPHCGERTMFQCPRCGREQRWNLIRLYGGWDMPIFMWVVNVQALAKNEEQRLLQNERVEAAKRMHGLWSIFSYWKTMHLVVLASLILATITAIIMAVTTWPLKN